jgi:hypothetical protein
MAASVFYWSEFFDTDPEARVRFPALPDKKNSGSGTGSTQPRDYNYYYYYYYYYYYKYYGRRDPPR